MNNDLFDDICDDSFDDGEPCPSWCRSEAAQFVWVQSKHNINRHDGLYDAEKMRLLISVLHGLSKDELEMFAEDGRPTTNTILLGKSKRNIIQDILGKRRPRFKIVNHGNLG